MAPELFSPYGVKFNEKTEVFALGIALGINFDLIKIGPKITIERGSKIMRGIPRFKIIDEAYIPVHLKKIAELIRMMTDDNPDNRPNVVTVYKLVNKLFSAYSKDENNALKVSILQIDEFLKLPKAEQIEFIAHMKDTGINAVVLSASKSTAAEDYYKARYILIKNMFHNIDNQLFRGDQKDIYNAVRNKYNQQFASLATKVYFGVTRAPFEEKEPAAAPKMPIVLLKETMELLLKSQSEKSSISEDILTDLKADFDSLKINPLIYKTNPENLKILIRNLELSYKQSVHEKKQHLDAALPTVNDFNAEPEKYESCIMLGLLLKAAYHIQASLLGSEKFDHRFPAVEEIKTPEAYKTHPFVSQLTQVLNQLKDVPNPVKSEKKNHQSGL